MIDTIAYLDEIYPRIRAEYFPSRRFAPVVLENALSAIVGKKRGQIIMTTAGESFQKRPIRMLTAGSGPVAVLLWSQMHGDESTATMAICDILRYLTAAAGDDVAQTILAGTKLFFVPMLNPDGAAVFQRRTAQGIDMNRDARLLRTPEAALLRRLQQDIRPSFGFNLHDQELSTVGLTRDITALALLAPAHDASRGDNDVRVRAKQIGSVFINAAERIVPERIAKYDDSFEPRAFGDSMQAWGTSTLLVESGHVAADHEKDVPRKLNFMGILAALYSIATGEYSSVDIRRYESLPFNGKRAYDMIVRNVLLEYGNSETTMVDLGISSQVDTHAEPPPKLVDIGDLSTFAGLSEIDANKIKVPASRCRIGEVFDWSACVQ